MIPVLVTILALARGLAATGLNGEYHVCHKADGARIEIRHITDTNPCIVCTCTGGRVVCENKLPSCPSTRGCSNLQPRLPGQCCQQCLGCEVNGTRLESGARRHLAVPRPCEVTACDDGVVTVSQVRCPATPPGGCTKPVYLPGHCCPVCPDQQCELGGKLIEDGETRLDPEDTCRECSCREGFLTCSIKTCPVLSCPEHLHKTNPGDCCPSCARQTQIRPDNKRCLWRNKYHEVGASLLSDTCTSCTCPKSLSPTCRVTCQAGERQTCSHQGQTYNHGDTWHVDRCKTCSCKLGRTECRDTACPTCPPGTSPVLQSGECCPACTRLHVPQLAAAAHVAVPGHVFSAPAPEGVCTVFGDPHYKTFDGKIFNFQGSCKYLLTRDCSKEAAASQNSTFSIRITNDARDTLAFSWLRTVTVRLGTTKVSLLQKMRVKVDGKKVALPYIKLGVLSVMKDGYRVILRTNEGARLLWDGVSFLELSVPAKMRGNMCGLCGNFNGDKRDDFIGRRGSLLSNGQEFGNSWRVGGKKACSVLPRDVPPHPPTCKGDWEGSIQSDKHCGAIKSSLFAACHSAVPPQFYFKACRIDMCECPGTQCHCEVLTAYARECERAGIRVNKWREATGCRNVKPFKYSGEHSSPEHSAEMNTTAYNEVMTDLEGLEEFDEVEEEPLDVRRLHLPALPAYRYNAEMAPLTAPPPDQVREGAREEGRGKRRRDKQKRKDRRRRWRNKQKKERKRKKGLSQGSIGSFRGYTVEKISGGGSRKRLRWGGGEKKGGYKLPPFEMLLSSVEESDLVPHTSGEERTGFSDDDEYFSDYSDDSDDFSSDHHSLTFSDLPSSKSRSKPPPLHESGEIGSIVNSHLLPYSHPTRRNFKKRRQTF